MFANDFGVLFEIFFHCRFKHENIRRLIFGNTVNMNTKTCRLGGSSVCSRQLGPILDITSGPCVENHQILVSKKIFAPTKRRFLCKVLAVSAGFAVYLYHCSLDRFYRKKKKTKKKKHRKLFDK